MNDDKLQHYYALAFALHLFFIVTFKITASLQDVSSIGESGMDIQMIVIEKSDAEYESKSISENTQETTDKNEKDQEVILDDRQTGDISDRTYDTYFAKIRRIIDSNKRYPMIARQRQQEGSPKVTFTILKNGNIKDFTIRSSGHRLLDREARRMIMISVPFPKIPESLKQTSIKLTIPINFSLDRRLPSR